MVWIWLGLVIVLFLLELTTKNFVTMWYSISAIVSLVLSFFIDNFLIQFLIFLVLGTILLVIIREYLINIIKNKKTIVKKGKSEK